MNGKVRRSLSILIYGGVAGIIVYEVLSHVCQIIIQMYKNPHDYSAWIPLIPKATSCLVGGLFAIAFNLLFRMFGRNRRYRLIYYLLFVPVIIGTIIGIIMLGAGSANTDELITNLVAVGVTIVFIAISIDYWFTKKYKQLNAQLKRAQQQ